MATSEEVVADLRKLTDALIEAALGLVHEKAERERAAEAARNIFASQKLTGRPNSECRRISASAFFLASMHTLAWADAIEATSRIMPEGAAAVGDSNATN